jgi:hypothetical protein
MKLKKPKVRMKKSSRPKARTRITTTKKSAMPSIDLPEMGGIGDGLGDGGIGGFEMMPDLDEVSIFGGAQSVGSDLVGTFYDFKRSRTGRGIPMSDYQFVDELQKFAQSGWSESTLTRFYRAPKKLYATTVMVPSIRSSIAPRAFGEYDTIGYAWMVLYKGPLVHKDGITFRFWGHGDDVLAVRVDGEVVLDACWTDSNRGTDRIVNWQTSSAQSRQYYLGNSQPKAAVGDWITLEPGDPKEIEIMLGEVPGGTFNCYLLVEEKGVEYEKSRQSMPILPIFKTQEPSLELIDVISEHMIKDEAMLSGGPVFCDYEVNALSARLDGVAAQAPPAEAAPEPAESENNPMRQWTPADGMPIEAEYLSVVGENVILKNARGRQIKLPIARLSPAEQEYIELANPPQLSIDFIRTSSQETIPVTPYLPEVPPQLLVYEFGARARQTSTKPYTHGLVMEYFALGQQLLDGNKYKLLDRNSTSFALLKENDLTFQFTGKPVELMTYELHNARRGIKFSEYLVVISDKRGEIIGYKSSGKWLYENLQALRDLPLGAFLDSTGTRVHPTGPPSMYY